MNSIDDWALITAVAAVSIAVVEQRESSEYQRLSVEPYLEIFNSNENVYERLLYNTGLGQARIESVDVSIDGASISNRGEAVRVLKSDTDTPIM